MVKTLSARADAHVPTSVSSALFESNQVDRRQFSALAPTVLECTLEKSLYFAALSDTRAILKNLAELRATRVSKSTVDFLRRHEALAPLLTRLTKNYWLTLTNDEKSHRARIRYQSVALKKAQELLDGIAVRKKIAKKFFKAHQLNKPIRLSNVESAWLDANPECRALVSVRSKFLIPTSREAFDFSEDAFARLARRLRFEMLTPDDVNVLKAHGAPILPDNTLSLDDAAWVREPYAKAVLYRLVKYRKDEQDAQAERMKTASARIEKPFKRVHLVEDDMSAEPIATRVNQAEITVRIAQKHEASTHLAHANIAQPLKRIELESDDVPCEIITDHETSERRWIEEMKEKVLSLFGIPTKMRAFAS